MPERNWGRYLAGGLAFIALFFVCLGFIGYTYGLGHLSGFKEAETKHYQTEYAASTDERISSCFEGVASPRECVEEAIRDNHEHQRNEADLEAQRNMADWAFWLLVVSTGSLGVTAIGTAFLAWQVKLTREAVEDTSKATDAMMRQNEIAEAAQRPWLKLTVDAFATFDPDAGSSPVIKLPVSVQNYGAEPAVSVHRAMALIHTASGINVINEVERFVQERTPKGKGNGPSVYPTEAKKIETRMSFMTKIEEARDQTSPTEQHVAFHTLLVGVYYQSPNSQRWYCVVKSFTIHQPLPTEITPVRLWPGDERHYVCKPRGKPASHAGKQEILTA